MSIIDIHIHTEFSREVGQFNCVEDTFANYLKQCNEVGVVGALTDSRKASYSIDYDRCNIKRCLVIYNEQFNVDEVLRAAKTREISAIKINSGYIFRYPTDKIYSPVYEIAERYNLPVLFHTGDTGHSSSKIKYADPLSVDDVAVQWKSVEFVLVHAGNPWFKSAALVASKNRNVYIEASNLIDCNAGASTNYRLKKFVVEPISWLMGYINDPNKLLYGSGWPMVDMKLYLECYKEAIPDEFHEKVFYKNAVDLFGFV